MIDPTIRALIDAHYPQLAALTDEHQWAQNVCRLAAVPGVSMQAYTPIARVAVGQEVSPTWLGL